MNKLRTLLTWGLLAAVTHVMGYTITVDPIQIQAGQSTYLIINLSNPTETNLTAYQMSLYLPQGVTVQKKANGKYAYTVNADRQDPDLFTNTVKDAADGSILIAVFSADKDVLTGTSGELIRLPIEVASTVTTSLQGSIKNIEFTDVNAQAHKISDVNFTMTLGTKDAQTLSLTALPEMTEGDAAYALPQQTTQGLALTWTVANTTIASINGYLLTPLKVGTTTVTATQAGNNNYLPFTKTFTLTVNEKQVQPGVEVTDISQLDNVIYIEPTEAHVGDQKVLSIKMKNNIAIQTIQFDLYLPEGLTVVANEDDELITASKERIRKFNFFNSSIQADGALRLLAQATNTNVPAGDGEICTITVNVPEDMEEGDYPLVFKGIRMTEQNNTNHAPNPNLVQTKLTIFSYMLGDANGDRLVDAIDFNMIANDILSISQSNFNKKAADINGDHCVDAIDFNMIANKILYENFFGIQ